VPGIDVIERATLGWKKTGEARVPD